jgi:ABC transporter substrate binding protein
MASYIGRRKFLAALGGAAAWPLAARAQQGDRVRWLAAIMGRRNADTDPEGRAWFAAFRQGLQELGWVEGRNFRADYRWPSGDLDRIGAIAKEFVDLKPDVMFAGNTPSVEALLRETRTIPIVFANLADPVGSGVVGSFAHPGGNATGFTGYEYSLAGKWLEILKEIAPAVTRVALLFNLACVHGRLLARSIGASINPERMRVRAGPGAMFARRDAYSSTNSSRLVYVTATSGERAMSSAAQARTCSGWSFHHCTCVIRFRFSRHPNSSSRRQGGEPTP